MSAIEEENGAREQTLENSRACRRLDEIFERNEPEIAGTLYYLYAASEQSVKRAYDVFRQRCERGFASSKISDPYFWVFRSLYNLASDEASNAKPKRSLKDSQLFERFSVNADRSEDALNTLRKEVLKNALLQLHFNERAVFLLRQNGKLTYEQIAKVVGASLADVKSRMKSALGKLVDASDRYSAFLLKISGEHSGNNDNSAEGTI